jgi:hypothetical protein
MNYKPVLRTVPAEQVKGEFHGADIDIPHDAVDVRLEPIGYVPKYFQVSYLEPIGEMQRA